MVLDALPVAVLIRDVNRYKLQFAFATDEIDVTGDYRPITSCWPVMFADWF